MGFLSRFGLGKSSQAVASPVPAAAPPTRPTPPPVPQPPGRSLAASIGFQADLVFQNLVTLGTEFDPQTLLGYRRRARWGDPRYLYACYDEMVRLLIGVQVSKLREALAGTEDTFTAPDEFKDDDDVRPDAVLAREIRDVVEKQFGPYLPDAKRTAGADKFLYGIGPLEIHSRPGGAVGGHERILGLDGLSPRRFRLDQASQRWQILPSPTGYSGIPADDLIAAGNLALFELDEGKTPLDQRGLLFQCLILWGIAQKCVRWWARATELGSVPFRQASYPEGRSDLKPGLEADMRDMGAAPWYVGPDGVKIEFIQQASSGTKDKHEALLQFCKDGFDAIILGHEQASGTASGPGSENSSGDAQSTAKDLVNARAAIFARDFEEQVIRPHVRRGWGDFAAENLAPTYTAKVREREDATQLADVAVKLFQAGAGGFVDAEDLIVRCGLKVVDLVANPDAHTLAAPVVVPGVQPGAAGPDPDAGTGATSGAHLTPTAPFAARSIVSRQDSRLKPNGREIVSPLQKLLSGVKSNSDLLALATKLERRPATAAPVLRDQLAALLVDARMRGVDAVRKAREASDA